jgi:hypothetical protein
MRPLCVPHAQPPACWALVFESQKAVLPSTCCTAGIAALLKAVSPSVRVVGCQPAASNVMQQSVAAGRVVDAPSGDTLSDGTAGEVQTDLWDREANCWSVQTEATHHLYNDFVFPNLPRILTRSQQPGQPSTPRISLGMLLDWIACRQHPNLLSCPGPLPTRSSAGAWLLSARRACVMRPHDAG